MFGALLFTFLKFSGPPGMKFALTEGWTTTLNIYSQVGLVTLVGLIAKNGILVVQFANIEQARGLSKVAAVQAAAETRLRPILMTTIATVAGHFPLTLVTGPGAAARNSIGIVPRGRDGHRTIFTLFVVPSVYGPGSQGSQPRARAPATRIGDSRRRGNPSPPRRSPPSQPPAVSRRLLDLGRPAARHRPGPAVPSPSTAGTRGGQLTRTEGLAG